MNGYSTRRRLASSATPTRREVNNGLRGFANSLKLAGFTAKQPIPDYQEKREIRRTGSSEAREQMRVIRWFDGRRDTPGAHAKYGLPAYALLHIPNGAGRFSGFLAAMLKAMGLRAGAPDLMLAVPKGKYAGCFCEMKYGKNTERPEQIDYLAFLEEQGYCVRTCWGADEAIQFLSDYLDGKL